jgi:hypothetical protein
MPAVDDVAPVGGATGIALDGAVNLSAAASTDA